MSRLEDFSFPVVVHTIPVYDDLTPHETVALLFEHGCMSDPSAVCPPLRARAQERMTPRWANAVTHGASGALLGFLADDGTVVP